MIRLVTLALLAISSSGAAASTEDSYLEQYKQKASKLFHMSPLKCSTFDDSEVKFYLYTKQVPYAVEIDVTGAEFLQMTAFDINRDVEIIVHDWLFNVNHTEELVTAFLRHSRRPVNVIQMDFSAYSQCDLKDFVKTKIYQNIAKKLAKFLKNLHQSGSKSSMMHIIGFGAGAHIAGVAAKQMAPLKVARITGLDPIGLKFDEDRALDQLEQTDADFVDVICTSRGQVGSKYPQGHVQFYPREGVQQQDGLHSKNMVESHLKAMLYFVESVVRGRVFKAYCSDSWENYKLGKYDQEKVNWMGECALKNLTGQFYFEVNRYPPYGQEHDSETQNYQIRFEQEMYSQSYLRIVNNRMQNTMELIRTKYPLISPESGEQLHELSPKRSTAL